MGSAACRSYSPNQWVPGKTKENLLDYFFELRRPVLFSGALVACTKRVTKSVAQGTLLAGGAFLLASQAGLAALALLLLLGRLGTSEN